MAKLTVADGSSFSTELIDSQFSNFGGNYETVKADDDLWRVSFNTSGEVFVRGSGLQYEDTGSPDTNIGDDIVSSGDISSFSFNAPGEVGDAGPALVRIRGITDVTGEQVNDAIQSGLGGDANASFNLLRHVFHSDDVLNGADQQDYILGFAGDDKIDGHGRGDTLYGGHGADHLDGGGGQDYLGGGKGQDSLFGGGDSETGDGQTDVFVFLSGDSGKTADRADRIHDFVSGTDLIDLAQTGADASDIHFHSHHGNTNIVVDAHDNADKMVIVVVGNDHVSLNDVQLILQ